MGDVYTAGAILIAIGIALKAVAAWQRWQRWKQERRDYEELRRRTQEIYRGLA